MPISTTLPAVDASAAQAAAADRRARRTTYVAYTALGWVVLFFSFHIYWYLGGSLASPGELPPLTPGTHSDAAGSAHARVRLVAMIVEVPVLSAWPIGAWVCLAIARGWARGRRARVIKALVWAGCVVLLLRGGSGILDDVTRATGLLSNGITGLSIEATTGHDHLRWADWTIDAYFLAGGIIFWLLATLHGKQPTRSRKRRGPGSAEDRPLGNELVGIAESAHSEVLSEDTVAFEPLVQRPVPLWARRMAHIIPLLVLPSALWRWAVAFGFPMGMVNSSGDPDVLRGWPAVYVAGISVLTELVALTAFGLVQPLGEEVPRWSPFFGGRAVRPKAVIIAATVGSVALFLIWTVGFWQVWTSGQPGPMVSPLWAAVFTICYAPLNLWGPALLTLTWAYHRRAAGSGLDKATS
ncbi:uncharacterized protein DUF3995 [Kribbella voronezhensis]|uniref:Uncharacterized protein DUF3995 n=1 Tax=Kribbella voronezhensis TaxID=2512212 RepID=A0A4R7THG1_9ACTN|nr:DUF3995 domain-containing protein [Kribbella voronezhensis]TDU91704.1 uncharacterized protein DUF3995 [Kribbella voronezhensis]